MQVDSGLPKCSVFIGCETEIGFHVEGSGFVLGVPEDCWVAHYVVTARHVIDTLARTRANAISIRANRKGKRPRIISTTRDEWKDHPDDTIDISVYPLDFEKHNQDLDLDIGPLTADDTDYSAIMTPKKENFFGINLGDEIFIISAFVGRVGEQKNIPVVRIGNIAALPEEPITPGSPRRPAYLIETRSLGGTSGAPVFLNLQLFRNHKRASILDALQPGHQAIFPALVIAMIVRSHGGSYLGDFTDGSDTDVILKDADFNAGISVALPISVVMETFDRPDLLGARRRAAEARRQLSGSRPS